MLKYINRPRKEQYIMIKYEDINILNIDDYDKILEKLPAQFQRNPYQQRWIDELKSKINLKCTRLWIEYPYYDSEYLSSYYAFYVKKFWDIGKACARIHFFHEAEEEIIEYMGYITVSPIKHYVNLSKSYLAPQLLLEESSFIMLSSFKANLCGQQQIVQAFPWMHQQKDFSMCAHIATWSILKFMSNEHTGYRNVNIGEVIDSVPEHANRKLPSHGLSLYQIAEIFKQHGITPVIVQKEKGKEDEFYREMLCYIESGIPLVASMDAKSHSIAIIGHGKIETDQLDGMNGLVDNSRLISSLVGSDDNQLPYLSIPFKKDYSEGVYTAEEIDFVIIPLYNRVHQEYKVLYQRVRLYLETRNLNIDSNCVIRIFLASANSLKSSALEDEEMNEVLKSFIIHLEMPKLVWCVEISEYESYKRRKVNARMIIDSTASDGENTPWLLVHDQEKIRYLDNKEWCEIEEEISEYNMYQSNLKEVEAWK